MHPDWDSARADTTRHLQELIRFNTVNPPGNELPLARYLEGVFAAQGIETQLLEPSPLRASLVARIRGNGTRKPVLLMSHMDVVGVEREHWCVDPFAGEVREGYLYGRGAIDDKGMLAANLMTMLLVERAVRHRDVELARDIIFVATADEEASGEWGMGWLIANHPDLVRAEFALNEGGRTRIVGGKPLYVAVQSAEKVSHVLNLTARGPGGHASIPLYGNAVARLSRAVAAIHATPLPVDVLPTTREFFRELSRVWPDADERQAMADVASTDAARVQRGAEILRRIPPLDATLRTTISATMLHGGIASNVIPTEASATLNVRTLPGHSIDDVIARLTRLVDDPLVEIGLVERGEDSPVCPFTSPMFTAIAESTRALDPDLAVVPYLGTGATDSARMRRWGVQTYGVLPFPMEQDDEERMHGNDERIPLDSLVFGTRLIYGAVLQVASA
jgi:acetylornithine deacetylase/succinyl-diaminopimelate desuccinylase-like protein